MRAFFDRGGDHGGKSSGHSGNVAQEIRYQPVKAMSVFGDDLEQIGVRSGDSMAFEDIGQRKDSFCKTGIVFRVFNSNADKGDDVFAELPAIDAGGVTGDDAGLFELSHTLGDGRL